MTTAQENLLTGQLVLSRPEQSNIMKKHLN